jgi:hypothetical protein
MAGWKQKTSFLDQNKCLAKCSAKPNVNHNFLTYMPNHSWENWSSKTPGIFRRAPEILWDIAAHLLVSVHFSAYFIISRKVNVSFRKLHFMEKCSSEDGLEVFFRKILLHVLLVSCHWSSLERLPLTLQAQPCQKGSLSESVPSVKISERQLMWPKPEAACLR